MHLCQEYFKRHNIKVDPIPYPKHALCFYLENEWKLLDISWVHQVKRVGCYLVQHAASDKKGWNILPATRAGIDHSSVLMWQDLTPARQKQAVVERTNMCLFSDQLDDYLALWAKSLKKDQVARTRKEIFMAGWQMFLVYLDLSILEAGFFNEIYPSIDASKGLTYRHANCLQMLEKLSIQKPDLYKIWVSDFLPKITEYSVWLADLV